MEVGFGYPPAVLALVLFSLIAFFQTPSEPTGTLAVRVVERGTNAPLPGVRVSVDLWGRPNDPSRSGLTAGDGTVTFAGLEAGQYDVQTHSETHLAMEDPWLSPAPLPTPPLAGREILRHFPGSASVLVRPGRRLEVTFELPLGGRITGRVVAAGGSPANATVTLYTIFTRPSAGYPIRSSATSVKTSTDGSFALPTLVRGNYVLSYRAGHDNRNMDSEVYYPGVVDLREATVLRISTGTQMDLSPLALKVVPRVRISGRVDDEGEGMRELIERDLDISHGDVTYYVSVPMRRDGTFGADHFDAGVKGLLYTRKAADGSLLSAATAVLHVGTTPIDGVQLKAITPSTMSGRFVFERPYSPAPYDREARIGLSPEGPDAWLRYNLGEGGGRKNDSFLRNGLIGAFRIDAEAPKGWVVDGIVLEDGRNILDSIFAFEPGKHYGNVRVLLSPDAATIRGRVEMPDGDLAGITVRAFPVDESLWAVQRYQHEVTLERDGSFRIEGVTPGREYYVATCESACVYGQEAMEDRVKRSGRIFIDRPGEFEMKPLKR